MGYWKTSLPLIWHDTELDLFSTRKFHVVDGGAAGTLFEPFDEVADHCLVYTFEPRGTRTIEYQGHVNIDAGLWSERCRRTLHVAHGAKASSIYPPNLPYLARFPDRVGVPTRRTVECIDVPLTSIDAEVASGTMERPNFIKLDIHSAEYEALLGCRTSLDDCLGLLIETWHAPIHSGQHLNGEIEHLLRMYGFQIYASRQASAWPHLVDGRQVATDRRQLIGSESLFLRETPPRHLRAAYLALLELFGYSNLAVRSCDEMRGKDGCTPQEVERLGAIRARLVENQNVRLRSQDAEAAGHCKPQKAGARDKPPSPQEAAPRRRLSDLLRRVSRRPHR